jgi:AcrR family transcriptional regulator
MAKESRTYSQVARAAASEATRQRIVAAFDAAMRDRSMDDITLDQVASAAGTTRQTVIRMFGGKEGLVQAFVEHFAQGVKRRRVMPPNAPPRRVAAALFEDYEEIGDFVIRMLAQEDRHPVLSLWHNVGRATHRAWIAECFAGALPTDPDARESTVSQLVIAGDVYTWKLLRRDMKLSVAAAQAIMTTMFSKLLRED